MKLVRVAVTPGKNMIQVDIPEGNSVWAFCTPEVKAQAEGMVPGDEINLIHCY